MHIKTPKPTNPLVTAMLTDKYQLTMLYAYWKAGKHNDWAVFDMFFRKAPFGGEFAIFAGLEEVVRFVTNFGFTAEDIKFLKADMPGCEPEFWKWLGSLDASGVTLSAPLEGSVVFPREPLYTIAGPLGVVQILETAILNLTNYPTLVTTQAARFRLLAGPKIGLLEFGLRRAQGPDGGISAARYTYLGGFDATSIPLAGKLFGIPVRGTHAHAFVSSFSHEDLAEQAKTLLGRLALKYRELLGFTDTNDGELAAFIAYGNAFPDGFLALLDTYDTLKSGVPNAICVALALIETGHKPIGGRLDSGDLAYLSKEARKMFVNCFTNEKVLATVGRTQDAMLEFAKAMNIVASNDINEETLAAIIAQGHEINTLGIGTHAVTCQSQPALGGVYKLVEINGRPCIKLSQDPGKMTIPDRKLVYRLYNAERQPITDIIMMADEPAPQVGQPILCRHPFNEAQRVRVIPAGVVPFHVDWIVDGKLKIKLPSLHQSRDRVKAGLAMMRPDHLRRVNPTPYKVAVSESLYQTIHQLWSDEAPIETIR